MLLRPNITGPAGLPRDFVEPIGKPSLLTKTGLAKPGGVIRFRELWLAASAKAKIADEGAPVPISGPGLVVVGTPGGGKAWAGGSVAITAAAAIISPVS